MNGEQRALDPHLAANQSNWDSRVPIHLGPGGYGLQKYIDDRSLISHVIDFDRTNLGDLAGKRVLHLQCHIGQDTVSLARLGATEVVGVDFSAAAIQAARELVAATGDSVTFIESDVYNAADALDGDFDVVYTSVGTICWLDDIARWAQTIASLLRPGGRFVFRDLHPVLATYEQVGEELVHLYPYWHDRDQPLRFEETESYSGTGTLDSPVSYEWIHKISDVLNALIGAGLTIDLVEEHQGCEWQMFPMAVAEGTQHFLPDSLRDKIPVFWSVGASG